jgi:HD-like signal output (HDOD) protein
MNDDLKKAVQQYIRDMPSFSATVTKVLAVCNNPQVSPAELNRVISLDPVLVARVLRLVNSAYYGLAHPVTSLARAIIMLGINTVKNMALSTAILVNLGLKSSSGLNMDGFWLHSLCTGTAAKLIAKKRNVAENRLEEYFTAGLLHDIGKIPVNTVIADKFIETLSFADRERISLYQAENRVLGFDHCAIGKVIVEAWHLEGVVGDVVSFHHCLDYEGPHKDVLYTVALANRFSSVREIGFSGDRYPEALVPGILQYLAVGEDIFEELGSIVTKEIDKAAVFLRL